MAAMRGSRVPVGSAAWISEERASALSFADSEVEEFNFSVRNDVDWLNEHMADVFNENEVNVAEIFKTPGKLRGKTPRTARKAINGEPRVPLSDIFSSASKGAPTPFTQQLNRMQSPVRLPSSSKSPLVARIVSPPKPVVPSRPQPAKKMVPLADSGYHSGYHGSQGQDVEQSSDALELDISTQPMQPPSPSRMAHATHHVEFLEDEPTAPQSPTVSRPILSPTMTFQTAKEDQTTRALKDITRDISAAAEPTPSPPRSPVRQTPLYPVLSPQSRTPHDASPKRSSPLKTSPAKIHRDRSPEPQNASSEEARSPSDGSSPIRPVVRKSSLNFASLPAREPLTSKRSLGARHSRTSYDNRTSYYGRNTDGKSLGNVTVHQDSDDDDFNDAMDMDGANTTQDATNTAGFADNHNKTYTQQLQDRIGLLGQSQPNATRQSKSIPSATAFQQPTQGPSVLPAQAKPSSPLQSPIRSPVRSSPKKDAAPSTPGAFPEDDDEEEEEEEEDWIAPPAVPEKDTIAASPRPNLPKSYTADVMEGIHGVDTVSGAEFFLPKQRPGDSHATSPQRPFSVIEKSTHTPNHGKSASVSVLPTQAMLQAASERESPKKGISVSNPTLASAAGTARPETPKSPTRSFRDSPLKQVKNKLSSIIKSSRGLLTSSAVVSAEGKSLMLSPSTTRLVQHANPSTDTLSRQWTNQSSLYPDLSQRAADTQTLASATSSGSPTRPVSKRTRASTEREKEEKRKEKEAQKEAKRMAEQNDKLEKAREKEREKARVFSKEQEKIVALEKKLAAQKEQEKAAAPPVLQTPVAKETRTTRASPRKTKAPGDARVKATEDEDAEMNDAPTTMPPPSVPRSTAGQTTRGREMRRPVKPPPPSATKSKQAPTVIRVNTGSQHSQYHPSNNALSSNLHDTLGSSQPPHQLKSKASQASLHNKPSLSSLKSSVHSSGRPKALDLAAKRKEQEEKEAQRKRDAKQEIERKRAALQEEEKKQEQLRRQEAERQEAKKREAAAAQADAKKKAAIERAKQTRAPPPAVRSQPTGPPEYASEKAQRADGPSRPPSRLTANNQRSQEDVGRPVNAKLSQGAKAAPKRPLPQDANENGSRNPQARNGPSYQAKDAKRRRTSDDFLDELDMESQQPNIKGPPVRPSGGLKKDMSTKPMYGTGYSNMPPPSASRDLFKATVTAQHHSALKATQPLDMSQFSKGAIPFAPNPNAAGPAHKTPVRPPGMPTGKSTVKKGNRSSPRFQNGEAIELPEIQTDDEDEDEDDAPVGVAAWADSPDLRRALMSQELIDPAQIFGPPAPLNMEEVFSKSKDRWHKFRARTSSANWNGPDRLTEEEVRRDLAARDKLRKEGGWSMEMSRDLA